MISIILVEDNQLVRRITAGLLGEYLDLFITATADNGTQAMELITNGVVADLIISDLNMPGMNGIELIKNLKSSFIKIKVIILTMHNNPAYLKLAMDTGASGYLLKDGDIDSLYQAIKKVFAGEQVVSV